MFEVLILSLLQGVTEFLPISSSSHLILMSEYLGFEKKSLLIDVSLHIGSFFAVLFYFREDIKNFFNNKELFLKILISSMPIMVFGYFLVKYDITIYLRDIKIIGFTTLIFGVFLFLSDRYKEEKNIEKNFTFKSAVIIGLIQILSLVPGVSRSGIAITGARFLNFKRFDSLKISFLLSIPTLGAVSIYGLSEIINSEDLKLSQLSLLSVILSFSFSILTIKFLFTYIQKFNLDIFVLYRIFLGGILLYFSYS